MAAPASAAAAASTQEPAARAAAPATEAEKFRFIPESQHSATLFVGSIAPEVTEQEVIQAFQEYGNVLSWRFPIDATTNRRLGYAYINYQDMRAGEFRGFFSWDPAPGPPRLRAENLGCGHEYGIIIIVFGMEGAGSHGPGVVLGHRVENDAG